MAGENLLPIQECPDNICDIISWSINDTTDINNGEEIMIFYAERDTIIDSAWAFWETADGSGGTCQLKVGSTNLATILDTTDTALIPHEFILDRDENLIPAGSLVSAEFTSSTASSFFCIQFRIRTRQR